MIQLYGAPRTRAHRVLWMLEELGLEYENVTDHATADGEPSPRLLELNPNGKVPTLVDGDVVVWESLAVNFYLADRYDGGLKPASALEWTRAMQWSLWVATEVEETLFVVLRNRVALPEGERSASAADAAEADLAAPLAVLDGVLNTCRYLVGERFSVADLNVASILSLSTAAGLPLADYPNVRRWLRECSSRPAARETFARAIRDAGLDVPAAS